jgi:L-serine dehydratase
MEYALKWWEDTCREKNLSLPELAILEDEAEKDVILAKMHSAMQVMRESAEEGFDPDRRSMSGLTGGQAYKYREALKNGKTASRSMLGRAGARALAIAECNAAMGRIVAAPTAGACGILPAMLLTLQEEYGYHDDELCNALIVAGVVGDVIAARSSVSGAQGGCQAECGSAAAMAAAAGVYLKGGSVHEMFDAVGFALMNVMGLVCDPVQGLVEVPCVFRNVSGVAGALVAADMALAGIPCPIPPDEVIDAMKQVGDALPPSLRETGEGGCAACPSMCKR